MKKITGGILLTVMLFSSVFALVACGGNGDVPSGMQLVRGGDKLGYYFYGPEEWIVENYGNIACTYASKLDNSSITFVEAEVPKEGLEEYLTAELEKFPEDFDLTVTSPLAERKFGNADKAYSTVFRYKYRYDSAEDAKLDYMTMQIYVFEGERSFIFTYTASAATRSEETSYYSFYLEKVEEAIKNFKFVDAIPGEGEQKAEFPKDVDGWSLVSDKKICYFDLYIPDTYTLDHATSIVSVSRDDGTNINVSEAQQTTMNNGDGADAEAYWKTRLTELDVIADNVEKTSDIVPVAVSGADAVAFEYKYTMLGKEYRVYQVLIVTNFHGFVFTYTAEADLYEISLEEAKSILQKMRF